MRIVVKTGVWIIATVMMAMAPVIATAELIDNGNGTITDTISGLMWLQNADMNGPMNWESANEWVQSFNSMAFAGYSDWRLPSGENRDGSGTVCNSAPNGANCTETEFATLYFARLIMAYNPGPFSNLRAGSYWTSTDFPGNPEQAMAQDFDDGGQNPFDKSRSLFAWAVRDAGQITVSPETPLLYGVVSPGPNAGALILIDSQNAAVSIIGTTVYTEACSLAFDRIHLKLYLNPCFGQTGIQVIDREFIATSLGALATGVRSITHRHTDNSIYGVDLGPTLLRLDTATGGSDLTIIGMIDKRSVGGIATRPDGQLFGVGIASSNIQKLFKLENNPGNGPRDTDVGVVTGAPIRALAFHPDGRLFATDGRNLLTLDASSGAVLSSIAFNGPSIGTVSGLAVSGPRIEAPPDVWLKDCIGDTGNVPSYPSPCLTWNHSPDIIVDNNDDGIPDMATIGRTNIVRINLRNRGLSTATGVVVRLYSCVIGEREQTTPSIGKVTLVGARKTDVGIGAHNMTTVSIPWRPTRLQPGYLQCLYVVLDHPNDRAKAGTNPVRDNNKAIAFPRMRKLP